MSGKHRKQPQRRVGKLAAVGALAVAPLAVSGSAHAQDWDELAQCESSGNWSIDTGNGYSGGLQFSPSTWAGFGGTQYAASAKDATRAEQIAVAEKVLAAQGPNAWPGCTEKTNWTSGSSENVSVESEASAEGEVSSEDSSASASVSASASGSSYVVQSGDTMSGIAAESGVSLDAMIQANGMNDPHLIYPGQTLALS